MSDWGVYELEDIVWDEFDGSDDHIVPHPGGAPANECVAQVDCHRKRSFEAANAIGRIIDSKTSVVKNVVQGKEKTILPTILEDGKAPMLEKGSWFHSHDDVFPASCDDDYIASEDAKASNDCFNNSNEDSVGNEFCTDDPLLGNRADAVESNLCRFQLDNISPEDTDFKFLRNDHENSEGSDLFDYGWPDIGNFEDVDRMFRNSDFTFGQGSASIANELSWFSASSHVIDGSEDTFKSGFIPSSPGSSALQSTSKYHDADMKCMPGSDPQTADCNEKSCSNTFQAYDCNGGDEVKLSSLTQINSQNSAGGCQTDMANMQRKQVKSVDRLGGKRKDQSLECLSGNVNGLLPMQVPASLELPCPATSAPKSSSQIPSQQKQLLPPDSLNYLRYIPYAHPEYKLPSHRYPGKPMISNIKSKSKNHPPVSCIVSAYASKNAQPVKSSDPQSKSPAMTPEEKMKKLRQRKQIRATLTNEHQHEHFLCQTAFSGQAPGQTQLHQNHNEVEGDSEVEEAGRGLPAVEIDSSTVQKSSCLGSVLSDEISLKETSFRQLQDVIEQVSGMYGCRNQYKSHRSIYSAFTFLQSFRAVCKAIYRCLVPRISHRN
ncbi:protein LNK1-like isoform X2 [Magnolia sinica]|uniref:protein LNK1-like isoform X2 n=1 Tax=Magnolia sinica TaxID=86752 RepID=UPI002659945B|nr:protein LNK1-like isoform X2 [Magnolia sinica]